MRNFLILSMIMLLAVISFCDEESGKNEKTLFGGDLRDLEHGFYGAVDNRVGVVADEFALLSGWRMAWVIDHKYAIGWSRLELTNELNTDDSLELEFDYRGFYFEYIYNSQELIHVTGRLFAGWGDTRLHMQHFNDDDDEIAEDRNLFVIEPTIDLELNLLKWMRIDIGAGYRYAGDIDLPGYSSSDFSGPSGEISLKFGWDM